MKRFGRRATSLDTYEQRQRALLGLEPLDAGGQPDNRRGRRFWRRTRRRADD